MLLAYAILILGFFMSGFYYGIAAHGLQLFAAATLFFWTVGVCSSIHLAINQQ